MDDFDIDRAELMMGLETALQDESWTTLKICDDETQLEIVKVSRLEAGMLLMQLRGPSCSTIH